MRIAPRSHSSRARSESCLQLRSADAWHGGRLLRPVQHLFWVLRIWVSSSLLRHYDESQILLRLQPQFCAKGADTEQFLVENKASGQALIQNLISTKCRGVPMPIPHIGQAFPVPRVLRARSKPASCFFGRASATIEQRERRKKSKPTVRALENQRSCDCIRSSATSVIISSWPPTILRLPSSTNIVRVSSP